ncbi:hypothetical protein ABZ883_12045 [Streptomyces sp. NPDC046977]|uniref:hypothetical protein n=1 Tax=Streptomyces sp. NPDC046977 TaxID=3154703 RepID=UPI0033E537BE
MRRLIWLGVMCLLTVGSVGCGTEPPADLVGTDRSTPRMRQVAEAWKGSEAARVWRTGFYLLDDPERLPEDAFHNGADKLAYGNGNFRLRAGALPGAAARHGRIRWTNGDSLPATVMTARQAYDTLDRGDRGDGADPLTVTKAALGEMTVNTSRGPARVPAWLLTLDGYDTPVRLMAVASPKPPRAPVPSLSPQTVHGVQPLDEIREVSGDGRTLTVRASHGACDDGPAVDVLETGDSVVLAGGIRGAKDGPCTMQLLHASVTVHLDRPLGDRLILDAFTGKPVTMAA